jgi:uncharacterized protein YjiK
MQKLSKLLLLLTLTACSSPTDKHKIADIPEASGISYCQESDTLVVANDEGTFYELSTSGAILSEHKLGYYDLEGVVCEKEHFVFAVEKGELLVVTRSKSKIKHLKVKGQGFKLTKKASIEGIAKVGKFYYLSIQEKKRKENAKILVVKLGANHAKVVKVINSNIIDSAGMEYHDKKLYIVSDKKDKLYVYNLKKQQIKKKIKLPKFAQEGVTFDKSGNVYFADDDGAVMKYSKKELGL